MGKAFVYRTRKGQKKEGKIRVGLSVRIKEVSQKTVRGQGKN